METGNASEAYRQAYDAEKMKPETVSRSAHELIGNPKVTARLAELREGITKAHGVTVSSLIAELEEARQVGKNNNQASAMVTATLGKAKLSGLDKEIGPEGEAQPVKVEVTVIDSRKSADS